MLFKAAKSKVYLHSFGVKYEKKVIFARYGLLMAGQSLEQIVLGEGYMLCRAITATPRGRLSWMKAAPILAWAAAVSPWGTPGQEIMVVGRIIVSSMISAAGVASSM